MSIYTRSTDIQPLSWNVHRAGVGKEWQGLWDNLVFCPQLLGGFAHDYAPGAPGGGRPQKDSPNLGYVPTARGWAAAWDQPTSATSDECTWSGRTILFDGVTMIMGMRLTADVTENNSFVFGTAETGTGNQVQFKITGTGNTWAIVMSNVNNSNTVDLTPFLGEDIILVGYRIPGIRGVMRVYRMGTGELLLQSSSPDNASTGTMLTDISKEWTLGSSNNNRAGRCVPGNVYGGYIWNRWLGYEALEQIAKDFYGIVRPDFRVIGNPTAAVGGGGLSIPTAMYNYRRRRAA